MNSSVHREFQSVGCLDVTWLLHLLCVLAVLCRSPLRGPTLCLILCLIRSLSRERLSCSSSCQLFLRVHVHYFTLLCPCVCVMWQQRGQSDNHPPVQQGKLPSQSLSDRVFNMAALCCWSSNSHIHPYKGKHKWSDVFLRVKFSFQFLHFLINDNKPVFMV